MSYNELKKHSSAYDARLSFCLSDFTVEFCEACGHREVAAAQAQWIETLKIADATDPSSLNNMCPYFKLVLCL